MSRVERKAYKAVGKKKMWHLLLITLFINIGMLAVVKYTNFMIHNITTVLGWFSSGEVSSFRDIALPMGISSKGWSFQSTP